MKTSGIIAEYNPFHLGHKYQINKIKKELNTNIIAIISGDFVQRGECAILDKYTRAKIAINNGIDLVIELPFFYSLQSAENFSKGGISILNKLNIIDYLCFGFECDKKEDIIKIANFQLQYRDEIEEILNYEMKLGNSYAVAYKNACVEINSKYKILELQDDFFISNNILSIEYVKNLILSNSKITPFPIKRKGKNYNDDNYRIIFTKIPVGSSIGKHTQTSGDDINYIISGIGKAVCDGVEEVLIPESCHICFKGSEHSIINTGSEDLVILTIVVKK